MQPGSGAHPTEGRQERLRALLARRRLRLLLFTNPVNIAYMTGFRGSAGIAALGASEALLWVDPRYTLQAREQARGVEVIEEKRGLLRAAGRWLRRQKRSRVAYEDSYLTCAEFHALRREAPDARFAAGGGLVEGLRVVKGLGEIEQIRKACQVTSAVFEEVLPQVRPGARELDLAAEVEFRMKRKGAEGAAFETIVASGPRAALPHARASQKVLQKSELVVFDLGAILAGYVSDMTRTVYLGRPSPQARRFYHAVRDAQRCAVEAVRPGARAAAVDAVARRVLARRGLGKYFTHSTGHGVGLEIHERPRLARGEKARLEGGCVVTVEPGIYLEGFGGIRVEDTVLVGTEGPEVLTRASKDHWFID